MPLSAPHPSSARVGAQPDGAGRRGHETAALWLLVTLTVLAYLPALPAGFVWDDDAHVTAAVLRSCAGLGRIWCDLGATQQYYPVLHSWFWLQQLLWGDAPAGYHAVNVALHTLAAVLVLKNLRRLAIPGAWFAAALFALHPVQVESVAWISEQKNTLSAVFYLGTMLVFWRFHESRRPAQYLAATALFLCALGSKTVTVTLPAAILVILWWRQGRLRWREDALPLLPWFALGVSAGIFTEWVERHYIGASGAEFGLGIAERTLLAGRALVFYAGKLVWPAKLSFIYPRWDVAASLAAWTVYAMAVIVVTFVCWRRRRQQRAPLAAWLFFAGTLFPALGFFDVYPFLYSYVADHFQYLASLGLFALFAGATVTCLGDAASPWPRRSRFAGAALLLSLATQTWCQTGMYRDPETFYSTIIARNPASWLAHYNLGNLLRETNRPHEAIERYERALALNPQMSDAHNNLGIALQSVGRTDEAFAHFERALEIDPRNFRAHNQLGAAMALRGDFTAALAHHQEALRIRPNRAQTHFYLGNALRGLKRPDEAIAAYETALRLDSKFASAHHRLGHVLRDLNRLDEARQQYEEAVRLQPTHAGAHNSLGTVLLATGHTGDAIAEFEEALRLNPQLGEARQNLAIAREVARREGESSRTP